VITTSLTVPAIITKHAQSNAPVCFNKLQGSRSWFRKGRIGSAAPATPPPSQSAIPPSLPLDHRNENFPNIQRLLQILSVFPVSTSTPERTNSCLKRIKTYLRNTTKEVKRNLLFSQLWPPYKMNQVNSPNLFYFRVNLTAWLLYQCTETHQ